MKPSNKNELKGKMHAVKGAVLHGYGDPTLCGQGHFLLLGVTVVVGTMAFAGSKASLQTVSHVDLTRYVGHWYEIARYSRSSKNTARPM